MQTCRIMVSIVVLVVFVGVSSVNAQETVTPIKYGDTVQGALAAINNGGQSMPNSNFYRFSGSAGDVVNIELTNSNRCGLGLYKSIQDARIGKNPIVRCDGCDPTAPTKGHAKITNFPLPYTGDFIVEVAYGPGGPGSYEEMGLCKYTLSLRKGEEAVPTEAPPEPTPTIPNRPIPTVAPKVVEVGTRPSYAVFGPDMRLYVSNRGDGTVSILDYYGGPAGTFKVGGNPSGMAIEDHKRLWVADLGTADKPGSTVAVLDLDLSGANQGIPKLVNTFKVGLRPISLSYDDIDHLMWIALYAESKIVALDTDGKIVATLATDKTPTTILWTGSEVWATLGGTGDKPGKQIARIAPDSSGKFAIQPLITVGGQPTDLAWDKENHRLFVANYADNTVMVVDPAKGVQTTYRVGPGPSALAWSHGHLWVALFDAKSVVALDARGKVIFTVTLSAEPNALIVGDSFIWAITSGTADQPAQSVTMINPDDYPQLLEGST